MKCWLDMENVLCFSANFYAAGLKVNNSVFYVTDFILLDFEGRGMLFCLLWYCDYKSISSACLVLFSAGLKFALSLHFRTYSPNYRILAVLKTQYVKS